VISARTSVVQKAVKLIDPDEHRREECFNAVHVALAGIKSSEADLRRMWERNSTHGRRTAAKLETAIKRLLDILDKPTAPNLHKQAETKPLLRLWQRRAGSVARDKITPPFRFNAQKKLTAAALASQPAVPIQPGSGYFSDGGQQVLPVGRAAVWQTKR
jgi:hypothetical protein